MFADLSAYGCILVKRRPVAVHAFVEGSLHVT